VDGTAVTRVEIPATLLDRVRARAEVAYPEECCGFLFGTREEERVVVVDDLETPNVAEPAERVRRFVIEPKTLLDVMRESRKGIDEVVGFYHSHPNHPAELSPTDLTFAARWPRTVWLIVPLDRGAAGAERAWWLPARAEGSEPYELSIGRTSAETSTNAGGRWT
jgi:proteasome lid subunit RPN8/RPN11